MRRVVGSACRPVHRPPCSSGDVRTESAVEQATPSTAARRSDGATEPNRTRPTTRRPRRTRDDRGPDRRPPIGDGPSTSSGDSLFPELGSADLDVQSYDVRLCLRPGDRAARRHGRHHDGGDPRARRDRARRQRARSSSPSPSTARGDVRARAPGARSSAPPTPVGPDAPIVVSVTYRDDDHASALGVRAWRRLLHDRRTGRTRPQRARWRADVDAEQRPPVGQGHVALRDHRARPASRRSPTAQLVEERAGADGTTWVWEQDEPMATYLVQVLIGPYYVLDGGAAGEVPLVQRRASPTTSSRCSRTSTHGRRQIAFFEPTFGPYPLDRYGLAFVDSVPGLAMEHQGRSLFSREDFPGGTPDPIAQLLLSHELAHQWFGNAVTPADWSDLWLNESFATYAQWLWLDHIGLTTARARGRRQPGSSARRRPEPTGEPSRRQPVRVRALRRRRRRRSTPCAASSATTPSSRCSSAGSPRTTARRG